MHEKRGGAGEVEQNLLLESVEGLGLFELFLQADGSHLGMVSLRRMGAGDGQLQGLRRQGGLAGQMAEVATLAGAAGLGVWWLRRSFIWAMKRFELNLRPVLAPDM